MLCPALVRTAISPVGVDPADVADEALAAIEQGRFAVMPQEWRRSVLDRAEHLTSGRTPTPPTPSGDEG